MSKYFSRCAWYVSLLLIAIGVWKLGAPEIVAPFIYALVIFLPASLFWLFFGRLLFKVRGYPKTTFGAETEHLAYYIALAGVVATVVATIYAGDNLEANSTAIAIVLFGIDGAIWARECKYEFRSG